MATRFELVLEDDKVCFVLRAADGKLLLQGVGGGRGKITAQNEILHVRRALQSPEHLVPHQAQDGTHFFVVKEDSGEVLARSPHVASASQLAALTQQIVTAAASAPIVDLTKRPRATTS